MKRRLAVGLLVSMIVGGAKAATFQSAATPTLLLELYTSEGCSSCPPAEAWLSQFGGEPRVWKDVVPVAFHVDYWDYLGWRDVLASKRYSVRQRRLSADAGTNMYTPAMYLNGREWRGFFNGDTVPPADGPSVGVLRATQTGDNEFVVEFQPTAPRAGPFDACATLLGMGIQVHASAGENRGADLQHDFTALGLRRIEMREEGGKFVATVILSSDLPAIHPARLAAAFWVTRRNELTPLQAAGGELVAGSAHPAGPSAASQVEIAR